MKRFLQIFIPLAIIGVAAYQFRSLIFSVALPCTQPIPYNIGTFATQFNISQKYFLDALADAEAIWETPLGKNLFEYEPSDSSAGVLKVNLIYDYRQQATTKLAGLGISVQDNRSSYDALKAKFTSAKAEFQRDQSDFNDRVAAFNKESADYEAEVKQQNSHGGASQQEFDKLNAERQKLEAESRSLQSEQDQLGKKADDINAMVTVLNDLAKKLNLSVEDYNTVNNARGETFDEGVYTSKGLSREIDIYEFENRDKLVRVLAHELGHALGLEHVSDPKAIMYEFNQGTNKTPTAADLAELKAKCGIK